MMAMAAAEPVVVEIANGKLGGLRDKGALSFKGIPYAADTGGANRFMAPRPVADWSGVRDATRYGERCPQAMVQLPDAWSWYPSTEGALGENCCVLNVFTPDLDTNARRPVMFYIHGGGFSRNAGQGVALDGTPLAKFGDAVVITVNHRLNVFGYTNLGCLDPGFADSASVGQLDLIAALNWVKTNVHAFGGDPGNVTLFGQSGGGSKINTLLVMPAAKGLFHRAINMSGSSSFKARPASRTEAVSHQLLRTLGIDKRNLRKIQELTPDQLLAAHAATLTALKAEDSGPVIDGHNVPHGVLTPEGLAMYQHMPLIFGMTESEARWFMRDPRHFKLSEQQVKARIQGQFDFDEAKTEALMGAFRQDAPNRSAVDVLMAVASEALVRMHMLRGADAISASRQAPLYVYNFAWKVPVDGGIWGSPHTADIPFVFGTVDQARAMTGEGPEPEQISRAMMSALMAFARTDKPNNPLMPEWKPYDTVSRATMVINTNSVLVNDYLANDRRASAAFGDASVFQVAQGPLFRYSD